MNHWSLITETLIRCPLLSLRSGDRDFFCVPAVLAAYYLPQVTNLRGSLVCGSGFARRVLEQQCGYRVCLISFPRSSVGMQSGRSSVPSLIT